MIGELGSISPPWSKKKQGVFGEIGGIDKRDEWERDVMAVMMCDRSERARLGMREMKRTSCCRVIEI
jgi:hypothetical protein